MTKTLDITDSKGAAANIADLKRWGDPDTWELIAKASSNAEGWMKSTKAMEIPGIGCIIQVSTQQRNPDGSYSLAEALTFVPFAAIVDTRDENGTVIERSIAMQSLEAINE